MIEFTSAELDAPSLAKIQSLLQEVFPKAHHFTPEYMHWMYCLNPSGESIAMNAVHQGRLVGHVAGQRISGIWGELEDEEGILIHNVCVRPEYQGKGIFGNLLRECLRLAEHLGVGHMLAVPNAQSTPGFVRTLKCQAVTQLEARLGIGRLPKAPKRLDGYRRRWTPETLAWRLSWPGRKYWTSGEWTMGATGWPLIQVALTGDEALTAARAPGYNPLNLWIGWNPILNWSGKIYFTIPARLRPAPLNLVFLDLSGRGRQLRRERLLFDALDFDIY